MKKLIKIFSLLLVIACTVSCEENNDLGFEPQEELGWIQFVDGTPSEISTSQFAQELISLGVNIQVPTTSSDLTINYDLVSISGMDPNSAFSNSGSIVSPAGQTSYMGPDNNTGRNYVYLPSIDLDVSEISAALTEPMVFDVVLTGTSSGMIPAGLSGEDSPISKRIQICPSVFDSADGAFLGDYNLTISTGLSAFGVPIFADQVVTLVEGANGSLSRQFDVAGYLPDFGGPGVTITFSFEGGEGEINIDETFVPFGCASAILLNGDPSATVSPCGDGEFALNMLDFYDGSGGCGVSDIPFQVVLTKI